MTPRGHSNTPRNRLACPSPAEKFKKFCIKETNGTGLQRGQNSCFAFFQSHFVEQNKYVYKEDVASEMPCLPSTGGAARREALGRTLVNTVMDLGFAGQAGRVKEEGMEGERGRRSRSEVGKWLTSVPQGEMNCILPLGLILQSRAAGRWEAPCWGTRGPSPGVQVFLGRPAAQGHELRCCRSSTPLFRSHPSETKTVHNLSRKMAGA